MAIELEGVFRSLVMPLPGVSGVELAAIEIPGTSGYRLAKDKDGYPCLLVQQSGPPGGDAPVRLENIKVDFSTACSITTSTGPQSGTFTIVRCSGTSTELSTHFLRIVSPLVAALGPSPTPAAVRRSILGLVELFQSLTVPPRKTVQGLFGELLLIHNSQQPELLAEAWHRDPAELYDFSLGGQRIEVKSSSTRRREHYFSLDQLSAPANTRLVIASVFVSAAGGGTSVGRLFADIRERLENNPALQAHLDATFYESLGSGWATALDDRFDVELATESLAFFTAESVPRPQNPLPESVSEIRFRSDMGSLQALAAAELSASGGIVRAAASSLA